MKTHGKTFRTPAMITCVTVLCAALACASCGPAAFDAAR